MSETIPRENSLKPILVGDLLKQAEGKPKYQFYIPAYQRGYRWNTDQIMDFLDDLFDFIYITKGEKYCLQPIVVKKMVNDRFEVLDGQQRLTTIFILLNCIKKYNTLLKTYSLSYQTRSDSEIFLQTISTELNITNPDYYYISQAYILIEEWLTSQIEEKPSIASDLQTAFGNSVEFIWYEILEKTNAVDVFTRINVGKIALTNAELVKAVFLSKENMKIGFSERSAEVLTLVQNRIAFEWDELEKKLRNDKFWFFILQSNQSYETRIDYVLELLSDQNSSTNDYASFRYFYSKIKDKKQDDNLIEGLTKKNYSLIEEEWDAIKSVIEIFEEWFTDPYYYHFIGFLILQRFSIIELKNAFLSMTTNEFKAYLNKSIYDLFKDKEITSLQYGPDSKMISRLLLLFNIHSTYSVPDNTSRFPFDSYKEKTWSLEHVYAQNSEDFKEKDFIYWLRENLSSIEKKYTSKEAKDLIKEIKHQIEHFEQNQGKFDNIDFVSLVSSSEVLYSKGLNELDSKSLLELEESLEKKEDEFDSITEIDDKVQSEEQKKINYLSDRDSIVNLALLDRNSNSYLSYSLFDVKRSKIIDLDKKGAYIPIETKRVFLKYNTKEPDNFFYWTVLDKLAYLEKLQNTIESFKN